VARTPGERYAKLATSRPSKGSSSISVVAVPQTCGFRQLRPVNAITDISYGQDVHRRIGTAVAVGVFTLGLGALTALSKSKKHFIGVTWSNGNQKGGFAMQCDKNDYRGVLAGLEGVSGRKAVDSDSMTVKN
jgi:hypothetical protein